MKTSRFFQVFDDIKSDMGCQACGERHARVLRLVPGTPDGVGGLEHPRKFCGRSVEEVAEMLGHQTVLCLNCRELVPPQNLPRVVVNEADYRAMRPRTMKAQRAELRARGNFQ